MTTLSLILAATLHAAPTADPAPPAWTATLAPTPLLVAKEGPPGSSFHYDNLDGAFVLGDFYGLRGAATFHINGPWVGLGRLEYLTDDEGNTDIDLFILSGGAGYVHTVEDNLDIIGSAELEYGHVDISNPGGGGDDDDLGLRIRGGVRYQANDEIELAGGISFSTIFDEDLGLDFQALYAFDEKFSGFVGIDFRDDTFATVGVRYGF